MEYRHATRLTLEIDLLSGPIAGVIRADGVAEREFRGWLEFVQELERARRLADGARSEREGGGNEVDRELAQG